LDTNAVNLLGNAQFRDQSADGDNALFKIDDGVDVTGAGFVDTTPGSVAYGFQQFTTVHSPGFLDANGNGRYVQSIDTTNLSVGLHYITVRAFRHRNPGEPPIFTDFRTVIDVERAPATLASNPKATVLAGQNLSFQVTTTGSPAANRFSLSPANAVAVPSWLSVGNAGLLAGAVPANAVGTYPSFITAGDGRNTFTFEGSASGSSVLFTGGHGVNSITLDTPVPADPNTFAFKVRLGLGATNTVVYTPAATAGNAVIDFDAPGVGDTFVNTTPITWPNTLLNL
jgi:hypothetical protein